MAAPKAELITENEDLVPIDMGFRTFFRSLVETGTVAKCELTLHNGTKISFKTATPTKTEVPPFFKVFRVGDIYNKWDGYNTANIVDIMVERSRCSKFWHSLHEIRLFQTDSTNNACYRFSISEEGIVNVSYRRHYKCSSWDMWVTHGFGNSEKIVLPADATA